MLSLNYIHNLTDFSTNPNADTVNHGTIGGLFHLPLTEQEYNLHLLLKQMFKYLAETDPSNKEKGAE
jgi:hypothetical protein